MLILGETGCGVYGNSILSTQFFCKFKTSEIKVYYGKKKNMWDRRYFCSRHWKIQSATLYDSGYVSFVDLSFLIFKIGI